jgi:proline iminopeptidase
LAWFRSSLSLVALAALPTLAAGQAGARDSTVPQLAGYGGLPVTEGYVRGDGNVRLRYRVVGAANARDTVVYVHGGPGTGMREGFDLEEFAARGHALLMYDQRGAGLSELVSDPAALTLDAHAADLEAVRRRFGLRRLSAIGLSWGAAVVARWAALHPDRVGRIVFLSPVSPTAAHLRRRFAHLDSLRDSATTARVRAADAAWRTAPDTALERLCRISRGGNERLYVLGSDGTRRPRSDACGYPPAVLRNQVVVRDAGLASLGAAFDLRPSLGRIRAPALVVEGASSNVPLDATQEWARALPTGRLLLVPKAGHRVWLDQPAVLFDALDVFFRGRFPPGSTRCLTNRCS